MTDSETSILFWGMIIGFVLALILSRMIKTDRVMQKMVYAVVLFGIIAAASIIALYIG